MSNMYEELGIRAIIEKTGRNITPISVTNVGSHMWRMNHENSDIDLGIIYVTSTSEYLRGTAFVDSKQYTEGDEDWIRTGGQEGKERESRHRLTQMNADFGGGSPSASTAGIRLTADSSRAAVDAETGRLRSLPFSASTAERRRAIKSLLRHWQRVALEATSSLLLGMETMSQI